MNRIPLWPKEIENDIVTLTDSRLDHVKTVIKAKSQDRLRALILNEGLTDLSILSIDDTACKVRLLPCDQEGDRPWLHLIIGVCRPPSMRKILEHATATGAGSLSFVRTHLSEKSFEGSRFFREEEYLPLMLAGLAQSNQYYRLPTLTLYKSLQDSLQDLNSESLRLVLDRSAEQWIPVCASKQIILALGPERGWTEKELQILKSQGFLCSRISESTLRVEIAVFQAIGQLEWIRSAV